ncbi:MAG: hypothetical protein JWM68_1262 [Verrucomicrobiales bacterium]|nr:hypothetical protein [Verrucomicrobiales bacterium]
MRPNHWSQQPMTFFVPHRGLHPEPAVAQFHVISRRFFITS